MSSSHSGTIGRKRGGSGSSEYYFGSSAMSGVEKMRRQRSAEWHSRHGYSSSEDEYQNTQQQASAFDTQLLAQLLLQSQQLASLDRYGSDCDIDKGDGALMAEYSSVLRDNSTNAAQQQQQQNTSLGSPLKQVVGKYPTTTAPSAVTSSSLMSTGAVAARSTNPFLNAKYDSQSNSDSMSDRLSYSGSAAMLDRLQALGDYSGGAGSVVAGVGLASTSGSGSGERSTAAFPTLSAMPTSSTANSLVPAGRSHRSKSRTLNRSGMTPSSSGTSSNSNATAAAAVSVAAAMASRSEREKLKLQQIQMELREFAQAQQGSVGASVGTTSDSSALGVGVGGSGAFRDTDYGLGSSSESEPPPEPAPPEIPPRTQSLLMSLRKHSDYKLKYEDKGDPKHEEFIPTSQLKQQQEQLQKEYLIADNGRSSESQSKSIASSDSQSQQGG